MCGRFTLRNLDDLKTRYGDIEFRSSYNIGPGQKLLALTDKLQSIEWGFSPYWADKPFNLVNARIETLREKPSFSNSLLIAYIPSRLAIGAKISRVSFAFFICF